MEKSAPCSWRAQDPWTGGKPPGHRSEGPSEGVQHPSVARVKRKNLSGFYAHRALPFARGPRALEQGGPFDPTPKGDYATRISYGWLPRSKKDTLSANRTACARSVRLAAYNTSGQAPRLRLQYGIERHLCDRTGKEIPAPMLTQQTDFSAALPALPLMDARESSLVFFDIETTGFKAATSRVYLIGAAFHTTGGWRITQWLCENLSEEEALLRTFAAFLRPYKTLAHFNGTRFDIPYLEEKYASYGIFH